MTTSDFSPRTPATPARATFCAQGVSSVKLTPTEDEVSLLSADGGKTIEMFGVVFHRTQTKGHDI